MALRERERRSSRPDRQADMAEQSERDGRHQGVGMLQEGRASRRAEHRLTCPTL